MAELPFHTSIIIWLILISTLACFVICLFGWHMQRVSRGLPPVPQFAGSRGQLIFSYFYTAFFVLTFSMAAIASAKMPQNTNVSPAEMVISMIVQIALYAPLLIIYFTLPRGNRPQSSFLQKLLWLVLALGTVSISGPLLELTGFTAWLIKVTGCPEHQNVVESLISGSNFEKILMAFMAVIVAPITEECCFRGFVYTILKRWSAPVIAAVFSALLFSVVHGSLAQAVPLFIFGLVQCVAYEKARSLWLPVAVHMIFNGLNVAGIFLFMQQ